MLLYPAGVVRPHDLDKLSRVCRTICAEFGVHPESAFAQSVGSHILRLYMNGLTEEWELLRSMRNRRPQWYALDGAGLPGPASYPSRPPAHIRHE
jgi:hypothetical protein